MLYSSKSLNEIKREQKRLRKRGKKVSRIFYKAPPGQKKMCPTIKIY